VAVDLVLQSDICAQIKAEPIDFEHLHGLLQEAQERNTRILDAQVSFVAKNRLERLMTELAAEPGEVERMRALARLSELLMPLPLGLNLWKVQNTYWEMSKTILSGFQQRASAGDPRAAEWVGQFRGLGEQLGFAVKHIESAAPELKMAA
jgi:hypothetical protein